MAQVQVPFSYVQQVRSPAQALLQGYQAGQQMQEQRRQRAMAEQAAQMQQQQAAQFQQAFKAFATNPNKSARDYAQLIAMAPKEMVSSITSVYNAMTEEQQGIEKRQAAELISAFKMDPQRGLEILDTRIEAAKNAGNMQEVQALQAYRKAAEIDPEAVVEAVALQGSMAFGKEFAELVLGKPAQMPDLKESEYFPAADLRVDTFKNGMRRVYEGAVLITDPARAAQLENKARVSKMESEKRGEGKRTDVAAGVSFVEFKDGSRDVYKNGQLITDPMEASRAVGEAVEAKAAEPLGKKDLAEQEDVLRKEWVSLTKENRAIRNNYGKVRAAAVQDTPAADISLVFAFMKILDPTSVVRETEQATATNATNVPDQIRNLWNRVRLGTRLTPEQRADFLKQAADQVRAYQASQKEIMEGYKAVADNRGLDPKNIFVGYQPLTEEEFEADISQAASLSDGEKPPVRAVSTPQTGPLETLRSMESQGFSVIPINSEGG